MKNAIWDMGWDKLDRWTALGSSGWDHFTVRSRKAGREQDAQKHVEPCDEQPQVMSGGNEDGVDGIASGAGQMIAFEQTVGFGVADDWLDGIPASELAFDRG